MSPRPQTFVVTFRSRPIAPCVACDPLQLSVPSSAPVVASGSVWKLSVPSSAPVVASGCNRWGEERGGGGGGGDALLPWQQSHAGPSLPPGI